MVGGACGLMVVLFFGPALITVAPDDGGDDLAILSRELGCELGAPNRTFSRTYRPVGGPLGRWHAVDRVSCRELEAALNLMATVGQENTRLTTLNLSLNQENSQAREAYAAAKEAEERALLDTSQAEEAEQTALKRLSEVSDFAQTQEQIIERQIISLQDEAAQNARLRTDLTQVTQALSRSEQDLIDARTSLAFARQTAEQQAAQMQEELQASQAEAEELQEQIILQDKNIDLEGQRQALDARLLALGQEQQVLRDQLAQMQADKVQRDQALEARAAELAALEQRFQAQQDELAETLEALGVAESRLFELGQMPDTD